MAKKLNEDQIKWILSLDATEAEKGASELIKKNVELTNRNKDLRKSMQQLEAQGKVNSENYRTLSEEYKKNSEQLSSNREMLKALERQMGVNNLTMSQLKRLAQDLQRQLDNTSQALHPEEWEKINTQLNTTRDRMSQLKNSGKEIESHFEQAIRSSGKWAAFFGNMLTKVAELGLQSLNAIKDIALEGVEMAAAADGVKRAFDRLDDGTILNRLRTATKGTVTDLELMKATVKAKDFRIPLDDLGKYLQFAQLKAQQTGQSVEFMTESIVTGLGRQSVLILDNLGLSAAEINEQVSQTGDFMSGVATIVDKQLAAAGENYVSASDRATQKTVQFQNAQRELGEILLPLKESWDETYTSAQISTMELIGWCVKHKGVLATLVTAYGTYKVATQLATVEVYKNTTATKAAILIDKIKLGWLNNTKGVTLLYAAAKSTLTGNTIKANAAMKIFNTTCRASTIGLIASVVTAAGIALLLLKGKTEKTDAAISNLNKRLSTERAELTLVFDAIKKTNPGTNERIRLVNKLKKDYPDLLTNYHLENASLKDITRSQNEANAALTNRIATEMKSQAVANYVKNNVEGQIATEERLLKLMRSSMNANIFNKLKPAMAAFLQDGSKDLKVFIDQFGQYADMSIGNQVEFTAFYRALRADQKGLSTGIDNINAKYAPYIKSIKTTSILTDEELKKQVESTSIITKLEKQKQKIQDTWTEDTQKNITLKNKELERIDEEIRKYKELGTVKTTTDKKKKADTAAKKSSVAAEKEQKARIDTEKEAIKSLESLHEQELQNQQARYNTYTYAFNTDLAENLLTKEQHELLMLELEKTNAEERLKIEKKYLDDAQSMHLTQAEIKENIVSKSNQRVIDTEKAANTARAASQEKLNTLIKDFKDQFKLTTVDEDYQLQLKVLEASYQARKEMAEKEQLDTTELTTAYHRAKEQLEYDHQNRLRSVREQYGLTTQQERFNAELEQLKLNLDQKLLTEEEYEQSVQNLKRDSFKKQLDYYSDLFAGAVQALQQAEIDNVDAQYDAEIQAAQGNAEEVERLEKEKAQKKLDIQKKYADINFAIKASQIVADTAVSIMKAIADLGPIAGPIAAALMGVTGLAQLASANAERQKVKNMTLAGSSSSGSTGARVATGRQDGGKIDVRRAQDGKLFPDADYDPDARGFISRPTVIVGEGPAGQSREWVASNAAVSNPTIAPILDILDRSQQAGNIRTLDLNQVIKARMAGYASGGNISPPTTVPLPMPTNNTGATIPPHLMEKLARSIINLDEKGVSSSVVLSDIERKQQLRNRSRNIGSKNKNA